MPDKEFTYEIKTKADVEALQKVAKALEAVIKDTEILGKDSGILSAKLDSVNAALHSESASLISLAANMEKVSQSQSKLSQKNQSALGPMPGGSDSSSDKGFLGKLKAQLSELKSEIPGLGTAFKILDGPIGLVLSGVLAIKQAFVGLKNSVVEFATTESEVRRLDQAMANNGILTDELREKYQQLAVTLSQNTVVSANEWLKVIRQLTQQGSTEATMDRDIKAVKALAGIYGDAGRAAAAWGKAMHGQFDILREHGIIVDQNASKSEKLNQAFEEIVKRGGGQLEVMATTLSGKWEMMKNTFSAFFSAIGGWISSLGILQFALDQIILVLGYWADKIRILVPRLAEMENAAKKAATTMAESEQAAKKYADALKAIADNAGAAKTAIDEQLEAQKRLTALQDEETNAKMAVKLAAVDALEKQGKISKIDAMNRRHDIRQSGALENFNRDKVIKDAEIEAARQKKAINDEEQDERSSGFKDLESKYNRDMELMRQRQSIVRRKVELPEPDWLPDSDTSGNFERGLRGEKMVYPDDARRAAKKKRDDAVEFAKAKRDSDLGKFDSDPNNKLSGVTKSEVDAAGKISEEGGRKWSEENRKLQRELAKALDAKTLAEKMVRYKFLDQDIRQAGDLGMFNAGDEGPLSSDVERRVNPATRHGPPGRTSGNFGVTDRGWDQFVPRPPAAPMFPGSDVERTMSESDEVLAAS